MKIKINTEKPYFAEFPYYLWGEVNYDSDGDCKHPTDKNWTYLYLENRESSQSLTIEFKGDLAEIESKDDELASRTAKFLQERCNGEIIEGELDSGDWDHLRAMQRTKKLKQEFELDLLKPFDNEVFWGSWKWTGHFGTTFTWVGRLIMDSIIRNDSRAVFLCIDWLEQGTYNEKQSEALRYALAKFTGEQFSADKDWVSWYNQEGNLKFPEPDFHKWEDDLDKNKNWL